MEKIKTSINSLSDINRKIAIAKAKQTEMDEDLQDLLLRVDALDNNIDRISNQIDILKLKMK